MTTDPNRNARWCRLIAEELHRGGVAFVVLCPGSRNGPLLFALARQFGAAAISHVDERSAGFIAIGLARATGARVAVCVTSGSAVANLLPAITEADAAELPIVAISADRPWEAHSVGSPQTMPQHGIFQAFVRSTLQVGEPTDDDRALRSLRAQVSRLAQTWDGPTHLNVPLRDPLPPLPDPAWMPVAISDEAMQGRGPTTPFTQRTFAAATPFDPALIAALQLRPGLRGVIVAGCQNEPMTSASPAFALARATGFPLLADAPSHLRTPNAPNLISTFDALATGALAEAHAELVIQLGPAPLTRAAYEWCDRQRCPWLTFSGGKNQDFLHRAWATIEGGWGAALTALAQILTPGDAAWRKRWITADAAAQRVLNERTLALGWSESLVTSLSVNHHGFAFVHLASSMAVRHANLHLRSSTRPIHSNRGVNGIDGSLGTFLGLAHGHAQRGLVLIGDLAALHDLPALASAGLAGAGGAMVVLNNGGGAIFDYLPVAQVPDYERWVRTSHALTFAGAATMFGLVHHDCVSAEDLRTALDVAANDQRLHLIECRFPDVSGIDTVNQHRALIQAAGNAATASGV